MKRTGGCACGALRYDVAGEPRLMAACHCKACQRRTGSAHGVGCFFKADDVQVVSGDYATYRRTADSGRVVTFRFCPECGTTVMWKGDAMPDGVAVAGGTFDETDWIRPARHVWTSQAQAWYAFPDETEKLETVPSAKK